MDDLQLNHIATEPRSSGRGKRFFVIAVAIAAGLHLLVFGALALSAHNRQTPAAQPAVTPPAPPALRTAPANPAPPPAAASSAALAPPAPIPVPPAPQARPERHVRPLAHIPRGHAHPAAVRGKPAKSVRNKPAKIKAKHTAAHPKARPAATLDLNALSHFNASGK
jgi:type IV secretory pathway VirB10-like protein